MDFIAVIRDIYKKGTDSLGLYLDNFEDDYHLTSRDRVTYHDNGVVRFNAKLLLHIKDEKNNEIEHFLKEDEDACYTVDSSGATLLHYAAQYHNASLTERFVNSGFNIDALDNHGNTPLLCAVSANEKIHENMTTAATQKFERTVEVLLGEGANVHMVNNSGDGVLPIVFRYSASRFASIANMFLNKVKEESPRNHQVMARKLFAADCPLPLALRLGGSELTREMLALGSAVDSCDRITGQTALHEAVGSADLESVKLLLEHGANANTVDRERRKPLMNYDTRRDETSEMIDILKILIDRVPGLDVGLMKKFLSHGKRRTVVAAMGRGCNLFVRNEDGETPVHFLARNPNPGVIDEVLQGKDFNANARDKRGNTALMDAATAGHAHAVGFLLDREADVNIANEHGLTPLHSIFYANSKFSDGHVEIVELLLLHGAKVQCDSREETIFDLASSESHRRLVTPVLAHLAKLEADGESVGRKIRSRINSDEELKRDYISHQQLLAEMKMYTVHELVTLYELLTESDDKMKLYASDREFIYNFQSVVDNKCMSSYYLDVIEKRVAKAVGTLEAENASTSMCSIM